MTATYTAYKLYFSQPLHLGSGAMEYTSTEEHFPSDALMSALLAAGFELWGAGFAPAAKAFMQGVRLSSAYPFCDDRENQPQKTAYFFPKPFSQLPLQPEQTQDEESKTSKKLKEIQYLDKAWFERVLAGGKPQNNGSRSAFWVPDTHFLKGGSLISELQWLGEREEPVVKQDIQQRVAVPAQGIRERVAPQYEASGEDARDPKPYFQQRVYFGPHAGLYFLAQFEDPQQQAVLEAALRLLQDNGIGTDRNVGNGKFCFERVDQFQLEVPERANDVMAMGLYCPKQAELTNTIDLKASAYELQMRGGWLASPQDPAHQNLRKNSVYMFSEGSRLQLRSSRGEMPAGRYINLQPPERIQHPIWRDGQPLFLPIVSFQETPSPTTES